jgi:hypothetical protein
VPSYGRTRKRREEVTYAQIERAATDILKTGVRPTLEGVRTAVGGGSPRTILDGLNRYWRDLGNQVAGSPDTLRRMPAAVADLAEDLWQRALSAAVEAAQAAHSDADGQLSRLKSQLELRSRNGRSNWMAFCAPESARSKNWRSTSAPPSPCSRSGTSPSLVWKPELPLPRMRPRNIVGDLLRLFSAPSPNIRQQRQSR